MSTQSCFLHLDMDAFFASVEQHDHPEWKGKPVIVGGLPGEPRSVVSTASYEARKFGVYSAMPVAQAVRLCPDGIYTHGNYRRYSEISAAIMEILCDYSPDVHQISIDEASVDITGTELLFGTPETLSDGIRCRIMEKTGLSVSIGVAPTRYLAKLASEVKKPAGFFRILPGDEQNFMLSLPLEKVWGIGKKTLERLNRAGFRTTKDIFRQSEKLLKTLFGDSMGAFLYNTVRGLETAQKSEGSHSISAEETFPEDITDTYAAETKLMELSHSVMFRLKKEKAFSKTVMIKIRYEDFSTVTVQETSDDYITSQDELFERAKNLFSRKYERFRGIRLLGLGFENVLDKNAPQQELLFDFGAKKKQAVEDAILKLSDKHPEIQVKKARLITKPKQTAIFGALMAGLLALCAPASHAEETTLTASGAAALESPLTMIPPRGTEAPFSLFNLKKDSREIEFLAEGWWQGEMTGGIKATYGKKNGTEASGTSLIFRQQVDMSLWFMLNRQWYFEAAFADEFTKNTVAAGFYGKDTNPLREFRIANRGIVFPSDYSIELFNRGIGGGENQAPGMYARFNDPISGRWKADFALRYDMTEQKEATFYGMNSVGTQKTSLSDYVAGQFFALPEESALISQVKAIYIEDSNGTYRDARGQKYKQLSADEFLVLEARSLIVISKDAGIKKKDAASTNIICTFWRTPVSADFGSYRDKSTFLGEIQALFGTQTDLSAFAYDFFTQLDGETALLLQSGAGFSPFVCAEYYDLGSSAAQDVLVGSGTTEKAMNGIAAELTEDFQTFLDSAFFYKNHSYAKIWRTDDTATAARTGAPTPQERYPLAHILPGAYLGFEEKTDTLLLSKNYTPVKAFDIGTNAAAGSVRAYKNGILDAAATYSAETGYVTLSSTVSELDKIYITWNEDSAEFERGVIAAQASLGYFFTPALSADFSVATNWTVSPYIHFAEYQKSAAGYATAASGVRYKIPGIRLENALAATLENRNVTGVYRVSGMDDAETRTFYHAKTALFVLRNGILPYADGALLAAENDGTVNTSSTQGKADGDISGYKLPLEWNFTRSGVKNWAATNVALASGTWLKNSSIFRIALKNETTECKDFALYLNLGVEASDDPETEYSERVPLWCITEKSANVPEPFIPGESGWQTVEIRLSDADRSRLRKNHDLRLFVVSQTASEGTVSIGPYEITGQGMYLSASSCLSVAAEQKKDNTIPEKEFFNFSDDNSVQKLLWEPETDGTVSYEKSLVYAATYFDETDIFDYETVELLVKYEASATSTETEGESFSEGDDYLSLMLDTDATSILQAGRTALFVHLKKAAFGALTQNQGVWHRLSIDSAERRVFIDGTALSEDSYECTAQESIIQSRVRLCFTTADEAGSHITSGSLCIDELVLRGSRMNAILQDALALELRKDGIILAPGGMPLVEDARFSSRSNITTTIPMGGKKSGDTICDTSASAAITLCSVKIDADAAFSLEEAEGLVSAAHSIATVGKLSETLSASDRFIFNRADESVEKHSKASLSLSRLGIPLTVSAAASSARSRTASTSAMNAGAEFSARRMPVGISAHTSAHADQKSACDAEELSALTEKNYAEAYGASWADSVSGGSADARLRTVGGETALSLLFRTLSFSPEVTASASEKYAASTAASYTDSLSLKTELPFSLGRQSFSLAYTKSGGGTERAKAGGSFAKDAETLFCHIKTHDFVLTTAPFYDFFADSLPHDMASIRNDNADAETLSYSALYSFDWKRLIFADLRDVLIPTRLRLSAERALTTADTQSDFYILKTTVINTPMNIFGSQGTYKAFTWFKTDEYTLSFTGSAKIPATEPKNTTYALSAYIQSGWYLRENDIIQSGAEFNLRTDPAWVAEGTLLYRREAPKSPVRPLLSAIVKTQDVRIAMQRTDSLDATFSYEDELFTQKYELTHKLNADIGRIFSAYTGLTASAAYTSKQILTLNLSGTLGGKLTF